MKGNLSTLSQIIDVITVRKRTLPGQADANLSQGTERRVSREDNVFAWKIISLMMEYPTSLSMMKEEGLGHALFSANNIHVRDNTFPS
tara:strand:+ start:2514 stop:2777 length:264 start_codon:yes stop_codon:yes gene_type:complete